MRWVGFSGWKAIAEIFGTFLLCFSLVEWKRELGSIYYIFIVGLFIIVMLFSLIQMLICKKNGEE
jgi:glycerol uptake facilitator-like aquaporin